MAFGDALSPVTGFNRSVYPLLLYLLIPLSGCAQQIDIVRPNGEIYKTIRRSNQLNLTYQQTPFIQVNYTGRVADITADTLFMVDKRVGLQGLAIEKITGLQRLQPGLNLVYTVSGVVLLGLVNRRFVRPVLAGKPTGETFFASLLAGSIGLTGVTLLTRWITPRKPRKQISRGWTFRAANVNTVVLADE